MIEQDPAPGPEDDEAEADTVARPDTVASPPPSEPEPSAPEVSAQAPRGKRTTAAQSVEGSTTITSPLEALARDEVLRTRRFTVIGIIIAAGGAAAVAMLPGDPFATRLLIGAIVVGATGMTYLLIRTRNAIRLEGWSVVVSWYVPALCVTSVVPYFGAFSPAPLLLVLGIYFLGLGASGKLAAAIYVTCAGVQAVIAGLVIAGVTRDTGIVRPVGLSAQNAIIVQLLVQLVLAATFVIARVSRRTALIALGELQTAVKAVSHREALLEEARDELERALKSGRGRGRFSEQTIGGFRLGTVIGRGAMGEVYEATPSDGTEPVAVKLLAQTSLGNATHIRRFLRELRAAAAIDSPNVVRVIAVGETPVPYLVMERLDGKDLAETLRGKRTMPPAQVVDLVHQVGAGITAAGAAGVIHRDLKPQNLFLHHATWKILDFGVSRLADATATLTAGHIVGTPSYMAPEQARSADVDHRTDLYALAAIAYRALTGVPPYSGRDIANTLYRVVHGAPARPSTIVALPDDIDLVLAIGLAKDPDRRFPTAAELAAALAAAVDGALPPALRDRARALDRTAWSAS